MLALHARRSSVSALLPAVATLALLATTGCGGPPEPVGRLAAEPATLVLPYPRSVEVMLRWTMLADVDAGGERPTVFVHLLDADGGVARTFDHAFPRDWKAGGEASYSLTLYQSMLGPPLPEGRYRLTAGLYDPEQRWALESGEEIGHQEYVIAQVDVPPAQRDALPAIDFAGSWGPLVAGGDRQVLGYRWLGGGGTIRLGEVTQAARLGLVVEIPDLPPDEMATADGDAPRLALQSDCDGSQHTLSGAGPAAVAIAVPAGPGCQLTLAPNYQLTGEHAAQLEGLARLIVVTWEPQG